MTKLLPLNSTIGILGGGQLARMLSLACVKLGLSSHILDPNPSSPAFEVAKKFSIASFQDKKALEKFAREIDVLTYEFENIPLDTINYLKQFCKIFPDINALEISQDRLLEKKFLNDIGLKTAPYHKVDSLPEFTASIDKIGFPAILKTRKFGYDGKGQALIENKKSALQAFDLLKKTPLVMEKFIPFEKEISVIVTRNLSGEVVCFDPGENQHKNGILHSTTVPANISLDLQMDAVLLAAKIANSLDYTGVMGVELFLKKDKTLIVNEIAPRVHNSGHWTQNGCSIDQFDQHIRAISGRKLGDGKRHLDIRMVNLLGNDILKYSNSANGALHIYGKKEMRSGRKMGHINYIL